MWEKFILNPVLYVLMIGVLFEKYCLNVIAIKYVYGVKYFLLDKQQYFPKKMKKFVPLT